MKVKDLISIIHYSQVCKCFITYKNPDVEDREIWGPFGSIYNWISNFNVVSIYTSDFERGKYLFLTLTEV